MKLIQTYHADMLNGVGLREVLFFSGCSHHCDSCFSPETWDPDMKDAHEWTETDWENLKEQLSKPYIAGVTLSGGDPLSSWNAPGIYNLCKRIKDEFPNKTIWAYTGYTWEALLSFQFSARLENVYKNKCLEFIDVLCDGPFQKDKVSPNKPWVGSENQRVIDVQKSLKQGEIVLWEE